eukprot:SAG22_NODE_552_length_9177_cov_15.661489_1_plen_40_part_00
MLGTHESKVGHLKKLRDQGVRLQPDADARDFAHYQQRYL